MIGNKRNFSLTILDHEDNFLCTLKSANSDFEGQSYNENFIENINGEKTLTFSVPMYIFQYNQYVDEVPNLNDKNNFVQNEIWRHIYNEQKIRYIEYNSETQEKERIEEFVLKNYVESRNGEQKIANCTCESLAVYELSKIGWSINFDLDYVSNYELENTEDLLTLDYWMRKIFYKETNLGKVSNTTECSYLLQGLQLRNEDGAPINKEYTIDENGNYIYQIIEEPIATSNDVEQYKNETGWSWEILAKDVRNPGDFENINILYEEPVINRYIEITPNQYKAFSYQKNINESDDNKRLLPHPIEKENYNSLVYVTDIKKRLFKAERSNVYSIIQNLSEIFEVFAYFCYTYNESGRITERKIKFKTEAVNDNIEFDFSYGKNLISCERNLDSNELVTKLIVPDTESSINDGNILSIKQATANPTNEGYLYNFKYFYDTGMLSLGENDPNSDEYQINLHCGKLKEYNNSIINLQNYLVPLYDRQNKLNSNLSVQKASKTAIMDNMQAIQDKIDAIPVNQQVISSWSQLDTQYNHVGELKTITTSTDSSGNEKYYLDFGREDIIYGEPLTVVNYTIDVEGNLVEGSTSTIASFYPRYYNSITWTVSTHYDDEDSTHFTLLDINKAQPVYSQIREKTPGFIKGIWLDDLPNNQTFVRIRYRYAPLAWYYLLIKDYWEQLQEIEKNIEELESQLQEITNKILDNELTLNNLLSEKNKEILQFEKKYKPYIREGYWEAGDYQSQINSKELYTGDPNKSKFEGIISITTLLSELNLNESLNNYSYFIELPQSIQNIDVDSITMRTECPIIGTGGNTILPRYRGNDFEVYTNGTSIYIGISPSLIDSYERYDYDSSYYKSEVSFKYLNSDIKSTTTYDWIHIQENNDPIVRERFIYLTDDNLITNSLNVYGCSTSVTTSNPLELYTDYTYTFDYAGYIDDGIRIDLDEQTSYSTNIHYDYITKITLKDTNKVNNCTDFFITYTEETTLQFLYQDAIKMSEKYAEPQITYNINVVDISSLYDYKNYKPRLGQKVPIYDVEMGFNGFEGFITSISKILEEPQSTNIDIATYTTKFEDVFQKLTATMTDVKYNENAIYNAASSFTESGSINTNVFQKSLSDNNYQISLGVNNDINIDKQNGILLVDKDNNSAVKLIGRGIFLTENYEGDLDSLWKTGITGNGINANALITGNIDTKNINIWNATEGQIRFIWNEQGLSAYGATGVVGTTTSSYQDFVDYNKYVRFNYDGLDFNDNGKSSLKLGWDGLNIQTQQGALSLDADKGLILKNGNITRLELGKLNNGNIYGLKLYDTSGSTSFQSDSDGNLWLAKHIKVGGVYNDVTYSSIPTAGIVGIGNNESTVKYQMGIMRDINSGNVVWKNATLRFYAGPQMKQNYLANLSMTESDIPSEALENWNQLVDNDPALSKFKVDSEGNIVASGIDVGGWIGAGKILRSKNYEAILRSDDYTAASPNYPVLAIGNPGNDNTGRTHNFRVYRDGSINIGNNVFQVSSGGTVTANDILITGNNSSTNNNIINVNNGVFTVSKLGAVTASDITITGGSITIKNGNVEKFKVTGSGAVTASDITITGSSSTWIINSSKFQVDNNGQIGAGSGGYTNFSAGKENYPFSVDSSGNIRFRGTISAYNGGWYTGVDSTTISISGASGYTNVRVIKGLIVGIKN